MFKVLLSIPPDYDYNFPPLGTPALSAFLKNNGISCQQIDLNLGYRDFLARHISGASPLSLEEQRFYLGPILDEFFAKNLKGRYYSEFLPQNSDGFSIDLPYGNNTNSSFYFCERMLSSEHLWRYLEDKAENTFYQFYETSGILGMLEKENIRLLGISIISPAQAIASLTLGLLVKKIFPQIHVTIGGQWVTLYREAILQKKELFRCFDSAVAFEGESALYKLVKRLEAGQDISSISNVIVIDTARDISLTRIEENMDLLPCPDFDGLPLKDYEESRGVKASLTFETSRGCYWSKCAYCVDLPLPKPSYRKKDPALVVDDMERLKREYDASMLYFGDPGLSPRQMREVSKEILQKRMKIGWWTMARLDPGFDREVFDLAHAAGLRKINFGFESASDRVCGLLGKGNRRELSARIIKDCAEAGIEVDLQTILGLPGESFEDGMETIDFLISNKKFIASVTFNIYYLTPFNFVHKNPIKYGVEYAVEPDMPFRFFIPFKNKGGMDADKARLLEKMYHSLLGKGAKREVSDISGSISEGRLEMRLCGETCTVYYSCDEGSEKYKFYASSVS